MAKKEEITIKTERKVAYNSESAVLFSLFSATNLTSEVLIPRVATDFNIAPKFLKLPSIAIPEGPKKTATTLFEINPNTKVVPTESKFTISTLNKLFSLKNFKYLLLKWVKSEINIRLRL